VMPRWLPTLGVGVIWAFPENALEPNERTAPMANDLTVAIPKIGRARRIPRRALVELAASNLRRGWRNA
jgi:hypothetical protein